MEIEVMDITEIQDELLPEYDLKKLHVRKVGPERKSFGGKSIIQLEHDVADVFPDAASVLCIVIKGMYNMERDEINRKFKRLRVKKTNGQYSPHKPLLVLYTIGKLLHGEERLIPFSQIDKDLGEMLLKFGSEDMKDGTNYPFWRLRNDSVWEVTDEDNLISFEYKGDISRKNLLRFNPFGGFHKDISEQLKIDEKLRSDIINIMLNKYLSSFSHWDILQEVRLEF